MEFITEIDPAVALALGMVIMGLVQAVKPTIPESAVVAVVFMFSAALGVTLALTGSADGWAQVAIQAAIYTGLLVGTSSGSYSIAKATKKQNLAGL